MVAELHAGDRVAIVEDDEANLRAVVWTLEDLDLEPIWVPPDPRGVDFLIEGVRSVAGAVISDHRLGKKMSIPYYGAEFVARSNQRKVPAVLMTSYANSDESTSIRAWRADIPRLLNRGTDAGDPTKIRGALEQAKAECLGEFSQERRAYQAVVRVKGLRAGPSGTVAEVVVTAWRPSEAVDVPASIITDGLSIEDGRLRGTRFVADVNIYAESGGDLYFKNIRPAPKLPEAWR
ncbi:hypothetical protein [Micromonospora sp. NPDC023644]|uniref:hypothetical protein n=1 Tax=Micromonospora sp. NPDC023644 TaxID=3154321 RepID=UPI0033C3B503